MGMITATPSSSGHCLCRNIRYRFGGPRTWACFCHCEECRRNCGAHCSLHQVPLDGFRWQVGEQENRARILPFSPGVKRFFCNQWNAPFRQNIIRAKFIFMPLPSKILKISTPPFMCITGKSYRSFGRFTSSLSWCSCWSDQRIWLPISICAGFSAKSK